MANLHDPACLKRFAAANPKLYLEPLHLHIVTPCEAAWMQDSTNFWPRASHCPKMAAHYSVSFRRSRMKVKIFITHKKAVDDSQGKAVQYALMYAGYSERD